MICHLNSFDLSKSFKVSPAEHLLLSTWRWACQVGRRPEVHAKFNCKLLVNQATSQSDNLCETLFEPHNSCPWEIIQSSAETPREHHPLRQHANIHTITYLWRSAKGKHSQGGLFCRVKFIQLTPSQNCSATGSSNSEASRWFRVPMDALGRPAFWSCRQLQVPTLSIHTHPANSTQKSNNQAQRCSNVTKALQNC